MVGMDVGDNEIADVVVAQPGVLFHVGELGLDRGEGVGGVVVDEGGVEGGGGVSAVGGTPEEVGGSGHGDGAVEAVNGDGGVFVLGAAVVEHVKGDGADVREITHFGLEMPRKGFSPHGVCVRSLYRSNGERKKSSHVRKMR